MKKIFSLLLLCSLILPSAASCSRKNEPDFSISVNESYLEPAQSEDTTYRLQETPVKVSADIDQDIVDLLKSYFDAYNKTESFSVLKTYTPTQYMELLDKDGKFTEFHMKIDSEVFQTNMYWKSLYGEDAIMLLNEIKGVQPLSTDLLGKAARYMREAYSEYEFDITLTEGCEITFNYSIEGSSGSDSSDMTVCAVRFKEGEPEYGGWKLIMLGTEDLSHYGADGS